MKNRRTAKVLDRQIWWTFAFMKAASVAESGSNLCSASLASSALQQWFIGNPWEKVPWFQLGFVKKSSRLRTVKIKELIKCRQRWEGGGSSIKLEQEVVHPHWLMLTLACHGRPKLGREQHWSSTPTWFSDQLATYLLIMHYPCKKKSCVQQIWFKWKLAEPELPRSKKLNVRVLQMEQVQKLFESWCLNVPP